MIRRIFLLHALLLLLSATPLFAQDKRPILVVPEPLYDFGTVPQGEKVAHDFVLENRGSEDLLIHRVVAACGCTASSLDSESIAPGDSGKVRVVFDTSGFAGAKRKTVRVYTNDLDQSATLLTLEGEVEPDVNVEPKRVFFQDVLHGADWEPVEKSVSIRVRKNSDISITGIENFSPHVIVSKDLVSPKEYRLRIRLSREAPIGELRERVVVKLQGAEVKTLNIPIFASVRGSLALKPPSLAFGVLEGDKLIRRSVKLQNIGKKPIKVLDVRSSHPAIEASSKELREGKVFVINVAVDPKKLQSDLRASIEIETDSEDQENLALSVYGVLPPSL